MKLVMISEEMAKFLLGEGPMNGYWFGDYVPREGKFWWRKSLREFVDASNAAKEAGKSDA